MASKAPDIRVGVIGAGWGARVHAPAIHAAEGYELVAICSRDPTRRAATAAKLGTGDGGGDWRSFVERDDIDLVSIASPPMHHMEMTLAAIAAGKHVYVEKPLAPREEDARLVVEAAERAGAVNATGFEFRWQSDRIAITDMIRSNFIGKPYTFRLTQSWAWNHPSMTRPFGRDVAAAKMQFDNGAGFLQGLLSHDIDYVRALFGDPVALMADRHVSFPDAILANGDPYPSELDDAITISMRFADGMVALLNAFVVGIHQRECRIEIFGSDGTIVGLSEDGVAFDIKAGSVADAALKPVPVSARQPLSGPVPQTDRSWTKVQAHILLLEDWRPAFDGQPTLSPVPTLRDGWQVQRIIDAARRSSDGAGWVSL